MEAVYVLLLIFQVTAAKVLPPTNVTLRCQNMKNILEWSYKQLSPGLKFKVDMSSTTGAKRPPLWVNSPTLQADVSFLSDPNGEYYLTVTAVIGENVSDASKEITFSYFQNSLVQQKCSVDLPPVNVTAESDDRVVFRFSHPWLLYQQTLGLAISKSKSENRRKRQDTDNAEELPFFKYEVVIINQAQDEPHERFCEESICEDTIPVDAAQEKHCLKITGEMAKMRVQALQEYCAQPLKVTVDKNLGKILYIGVGIFTLVAISFILFMVYQRNTIPTTPLPPSMKIIGPVRPLTIGNVREHVVVPEVEPTSPTPLLPEKLDESTPAWTPLTDYDMRMAIGVSTENECEGVCDVTETEQEKDEYMQGANLDEDEFNSFEGHSSYEKRQIVVELAPGEKAEGYRG